MRDPLVPGRALRVLAIAGIVLMLALLVRGTLYGYAISQMYAIASIAWGQVLFADLFLGLAIFSAWIVWREGLGPAALAWIVALLALGNLVACLYLLWALRQCRADGHRFWHGERAPAKA